MRTMTWRSLALVLVIAVLVGGAHGYRLEAAPPQGTAQTVDFHRDVRPVLAEACFACHGPAEATRQAELRLDTVDFIGSVVLPGNAEGSPLFQRLTTEAPIGRMPPLSSGRTLTAEQVDLVRQWIEQGAHWGTEVSAVQVQADRATSAGRVVDFGREVRPLLAESCFACHGPDEQARQAGLRLDVQEGVFADRGAFGGPAIVAGDAEESLLVHRVSAGDPVTRMPRGGEALSESDVETLRLWIDQGAEWESHWAFIAPERPLVPMVSDAEWPRSAVDNFILERLEAEGLSPSEEADRATLLRRVTLDLTGVPPTPTELSDFLNDDAADAYERAVDRLLASPRYGERMAVE